MARAKRKRRKQGPAIPTPAPTFNKLGVIFDQFQQSPVADQSPTTAEVDRLKADLSAVQSELFLARLAIKELKTQLGCSQMEIRDLQKVAQVARAGRAETFFQLIFLQIFPEELERKGWYESCEYVDWASYAATLSPSSLDFHLELERTRVLRAIEAGQEDQAGNAAARSLHLARRLVTHRYIDELISNLPREADALPIQDKSLLYGACKFAIANANNPVDDPGAAAVDVVNNLKRVFKFSRIV